ncbi:MAG: hypothetical protein AAF603_08025 [Pseudomonadota bacterium]
MFHEKQPTLVVIEDDFFIASDIEDIATKGGWNVVEICHSLEHGLATAEHLQVDAFTLDYELGEETAESIAKQLNQRDIPFIYVTGQLEAISALPDFIQHRGVSKPLQPHILVDHLNNLKP